MLLKRLTLTNYGLYSGSTVLDLAPRNVRGVARPVLLIGGKNGAGKTTILESIRLALYGRLALGQRISQDQYHEFLRGKLHRGGSEGPRPGDAAVAVEFDHVERGAISTYVVERSWAPAGATRVTERLTVTKDGKPVDEVDAELWPGFVRDIIPEGLSQLFFFDGEKIRELADDTSGNTALADAVKALLGLDTVERLQADLDVYSNRQATALGTTADRQAAGRLEREIAEAERQMQGASQQIASIRTRTDGVLAEVRRAEDTLRRDGRELAGRRERLAEERTALAAKISGAQKSIRDHCDHLFPISLCPKTAKLLQSQLKTEALSHQSHLTKENILQIRKSLQRRMKTLGAGPNRLTTPALKRATALALQVLDDHVPADAAIQLHGLSEQDRRRSLEAIQAAQQNAAPSVAKACKDLLRWTRRLDSIEQALAQIPQDDVLAPKVEALNELNRRLGALEQIRLAAEESLARATLQHEQHRRDLRRLSDHLGQTDKAGQRLALAKTARTALAEYLNELTMLKLAQLRTAVAECFNKLVRKGEFISHVEIDPLTFAVKLIDRSGGVVPKEQLSSGEKQIFAIALLWALALTSGRPLPVIIDTPLSRLDSDHRLKVVRDYLPHASHQVIVLSTDTEVDEELFDALRPHLSHAYRLTYLPDDRRTRVDGGYFWSARKEEPCPT